MTAKILDHVGNVSWENCCWTEDILSSKKIYPGYQYHSNTKTWVSRLRTSDESMDLMVSRMQTLHEKAPAFMRAKKPEVNIMEGMAERAVAVWSLGK